MELSLAVWPKVSGRNVVHGSDSSESANREIALWFNDGEIIEWEPAMQAWIHDK